MHLRAFCYWCSTSGVVLGHRVRDFSALSGCVACLFRLTQPALIFADLKMHFEARLRNKMHIPTSTPTTAFALPFTLRQGLSSGMVDQVRQRRCQTGFLGSSPGAAAHLCRMDWAPRLANYPGDISCIKNVCNLDRTTPRPPLGDRTAARRFTGSCTGHSGNAGT